MSGELTVRARLDTRHLEEKEAEWKLRLRALNQEVSRTKVEIKRTQLYGMTVVSAVMGMLSAFASMLPEPLRLIGTAAISAGMAVVQAITATAMAFTTAGAANPMFFVQAAIAWLGVGVAFMGVIAAVDAQQRIDTETAQFQASLNRISTSMNTMLRGLGGY